MSRPLRIEYENAVYHVMNRGARHAKIFHGEIFYQNFLACLVEANQRFGLQILAYCLMGNHYHLLLKTPRANLSRCMRHIDGIYTQRYNRIKSHDGSLFRGRYKAIVVDVDSYLLQVSRYIHRNPIEMENPLVSNLEEYPWSSYPAYINKTPCPEWLLRDEVLLVLNPNRKFEAYQGYVAVSTEKELQDFYSSKKLPAILGDKRFKQKIKQYQNVHPLETPKEEIKKMIPIDKIQKAVSGYYKISPAQLLQTTFGQADKNIPRQIAIYLSQLLSGETLLNIAREFGLTHYTTVSQTIRRLKKAVEKDSGLGDIITIICQDLTPS